jgi:hypothetical protein
VRKKIFVSCKTCGNQISINAQACPQCGEPNTPPPSTSNPTSLFSDFALNFPALKDSLFGKDKKKRNRRLSFALVLFAICFLLCIYNRIYLLESSSTSSSSNNNYSDTDKIAAFQMSRDFVNSHLKAPSTSDFPWYDKSFVTSLGEGRYRVVAYVDAQNSFGAKIRNSYVCVLQNKGDKWTLESINIK